MTEEKHPVAGDRYRLPDNNVVKVSTLFDGEKQARCVYEGFSSSSQTVDLDADWLRHSAFRLTWRPKHERPV